MEVVTKLKCEQCNRRVSWNVINPINSTEVKVRCPYCNNEMIVTKDNIAPMFRGIIFGGIDNDSF